MSCWSSQSSVAAAAAPRGPRPRRAAPPVRCWRRLRHASRCCRGQPWVGLGARRLRVEQTPPPDARVDSHPSARPHSPAPRGSRTPPCIAGATLSSAPRARVPSANAACVVEPWPPPSTARPRQPPSTIAADDERPAGVRITLVVARSRCVGTEHLEGRPHGPTTRWRSSRGTSSPSPETTISMPARDLGGQPVAQVERQPEAVETGAEVRAGRGNRDGDRPACDVGSVQAGSRRPRRHVGIADRVDEVGEGGQRRVDVLEAVARHGDHDLLPG